ncbi:MAG: hypothetical protein IPM95_04145 [Sphingobacteriales bacterium]|nr:hypothetical protein [Sphingobacteriales bacterium]
MANLINGNYIIKNITKDTEILESNTRWITNFEHLVMYEYDLDGGTIDEYGFTDIGDQYIAFRKKNSAGGYFYGWMLVNIENGEKITIKEYALHKIADTPIKAGEK